MKAVETQPYGKSPRRIVCSLASALMILTFGCRDDSRDEGAADGGEAGTSGGAEEGDAGDGGTAGGPGGGDDTGGGGPGGGDDTGGGDTGGGDGDGGDGGEPSDCQGNNDFIDLQQMGAAMVDDISQLSAVDRPFIRYITVTNQYNAGTCGAELELRRQMANKMMNALSLEPAMTPPQPIDDAETIFRVDLRDYTWDEALNGAPDKWEAVAAANPYTVRYFGDDYETLEVFAQTEFPVMSAETVLDTAMQPPFYYDLLEIPDNLADLEAQLGVDREANLANGEVIRSGFSESLDFGITRVLERHEIALAANRAMWVAYDVADGDLADNNPFVDPFGFEPTGIDVMFSLPNGTMAFMITDGNGNRLDEAPLNLLTDEAQEDAVMLAGISCQRCHYTVIDHEDELSAAILNSQDFNADEKEAVQEIYVDPQEFTQTITLDNTVLANSLQQAGLEAQPLEEPLMGSFVRFQEGVDLEEAAADLGIQPNALLTKLSALDPQLQNLQGGSIKRDVWTDLYAQTVCDLNLGETAACLGTEEPQEE